MSAEQTTGQLQWRAQVLLSQLRKIGVEPQDGMPLDETHAELAVHVLTQMLDAHQHGRHTPYCKCSLHGDYG